MSIFGSREDDPLLQDDPFSPADEDPSSEATSASEGTSSTPEGTEAPSTGSAAPANADATAPAQGDSAGARGGDGGSTGGEAQRSLVRSADEVESGQLDALNTAFDQGWRLESIAYREETADVLFQLRYQRSRSNQDEWIV